MKLALRKGAAVGGDWIEKAAAWIIKARLVTDYPHSGIVIGDTLYHATARHGLISEPFVQENWELFDAGGDDAAALALFDENKGAKYDWFSLLAFVLIPSSDSERFYCYEWSYMAMTGKNPNNKVIPEGLLEIVVSK
jgi:hypothetical protein